MSKIRKSHPKAVKFQAVLAMLKGDKTMAELTQQYSINQSVLHRWKKEFMSKGEDIFASNNTHDLSQSAVIDGLQRKIGELTMEIDFLKKVSRQLP
jgi:transposase-like protein